MMMQRRLLLAIAAAGLVLAGCATSPAPEQHPPIVFVHGNGDTAALWQTTIWRFESKGWPRERLHAIDLPYPLARDDDGKAQPGRTSTAEHMAFLKSEVDKVLQATGARQVVLVATRAAVMPSATTSTTAVARRVSATPCWAARRTTASGPPKAFAKPMSFPAPALF